MDRQIMNKLERFPSNPSPAQAPSLLIQQNNKQNVSTALFLTSVVRTSLGSHVGKPRSAYGWSGGFSPGSPVFVHLDERAARYK